MRILYKRGLLILVIVLMISALLILCAPSLEMSVVLLTVVFLSVAKTADSAAKEQFSTAKYMDAEWRPYDERKK